MRLVKPLLALAFVVAGAWSVGCAGKKRIEAMEAPVQPQPMEPPAVVVVPTPVPTEVPAPTETPTPVPNPSTKYIVVKGDTLWGIAGMSVAYKDNFQWPLIFKANRDQIKDPDLIYPAQEFLLRHDYSESEIDKARKDASDTPKYVPHTKPRETLPVDYF